MFVTVGDAPFDRLRRVSPYESGYYESVSNGDDHHRFVCCSPSGSGNLVPDNVGLRLASPYAIIFVTVGDKTGNVLWLSL